MMTVNEVSKLSGVSIRTLQYYDKIGLLVPEKHSDAGYRLYGEASLERLQQILLFRELEFSLNDIKRIIESPNFDRVEAIRQQIELLNLKKQHIESLIEYADNIRKKEGFIMDFNVFDKKKIEEYSSVAKEKWENTVSYREYEKKDAAKSDDVRQKESNDFMCIFARIGEIKNCDVSDNKVQTLIKEIQNFISSHYYNCTNEILMSLGEMYVADLEFRTNIDKAGGVGTAEFTEKAIKYYCR